VDGGPAASRAALLRLGAGGQRGHAVHSVDVRLHRQAQGRGALHGGLPAHCSAYHAVDWRRAKSTAAWLTAAGSLGTRYVALACVPSDTYL
jgi:hypothetical protein